MVHQLWENLEHGNTPWHDFYPIDVFALVVMTQLNIGNLDLEEDCCEKMEQLLVHYTKDHQDVYNSLTLDFDRLRMANFSIPHSSDELEKWQGHMHQGLKSLPPTVGCDGT